MQFEKDNWVALFSESIRKSGSVITNRAEMELTASGPAQLCPPGLLLARLTRVTPLSYRIHKWASSLMACRRLAISSKANVGFN